jgi:hypothetical protein
MKSGAAMPNITVTVSEGVYRNARVWAAQNDTSISAVVQYCIERMPGLPIAQRAAAATARRPREIEKTGTPPPPPGEKNKACETVTPLPIESNQTVPAEILTVSQNHSL